VRIEQEQDSLDPVKTIYFVRGKDGNKLITIPREILDKVVVKNVNGHINIYFKSFDKDNKLVKN